MTSSLFQHPENTPLTHNFWIILSVCLPQMDNSTLGIYTCWPLFCGKVADSASSLAHCQPSYWSVQRSDLGEFPESEQGGNLCQPSPCWLIHSTAITYLDQGGEKKNHQKTGPRREDVNKNQNRFIPVLLWASSIQPNRQKLFVFPEQGLQHSAIGY